MRAGTVVRYLLTAALLATAARHAHWSVALLLGLQAVGAEAQLALCRRRHGARP